jgi:hypothetical protein
MLQQIRSNNFTSPSPDTALDEEYHPCTYWTINVGRYKKWPVPPASCSLYRVCYIQRPSLDIHPFFLSLHMFVSLLSSYYFSNYPNIRDRGDCCLLLVLCDHVRPRNDDSPTLHPVLIYSLKSMTRWSAIVFLVVSVESKRK